MASSVQKASFAVELRFLESLWTRLPNHVLLLKSLAEMYTECGRYLEGFECDQRLIVLEPEDDLVWYNYACSCALIEELDQALAALRKALDLGYSDLAWMARDPDLKNLQGDPQFKALQKRRA